jgi:hypothetical protein
LPENVYFDLDEDVSMDTDGDLDQEMQQGHLCVSTDPRRVGGPGGEPTIINIEELRTGPTDYTTILGRSNSLTD